MMTLQEALRIYTVCAQAENRSERTIEWVTLAAKRLEAFAGNNRIDVSSINTDFIRRFILSLDKTPAFADHPFNEPQPRPVSAGTINCYVRGLKSLFGRLFREGYIESNPMDRIKTPKVPIMVPTVLDENELLKFFKVIDRTTAIGYRDYTMCLTLLDTGMRISELSGLTLKDVNLESGYFRLMGKGNKERFVPMGFKLTKVLLKYLSSYRFKNTGSNYFFITEAGGRLTRNRVAKIVRGYATKAGINSKSVHPHVFRATKAVLYLRHGGDPFTLQKCFGHSTLTMTRRYAAICDSDVRAAHLKFGVADKLNL